MAATTEWATAVNEAAANKAEVAVTKEVAAADTATVADTRGERGRGGRIHGGGDLGAHRGAPGHRSP